jgi:hypothetical protein
MVLGLDMRFWPGKAKKIISGLQQSLYVSGRIGREEKAVARKRSRRKKLMDGMGVSSIRLMASGPVRGSFFQVFPI